MVFGSIMGAAAGLAAGAMSASSARSMQMRQERYTERQMKNAHQWEVQDLENAGLNPVLSANSAHAIGGASGQATDYASAIASGVNAINQSKQTDSNIQLQSAQKEANESQSELNNATTTKTLKEAGMIEPEANARIKQMNSATMVNKADAELKRAQRETEIENKMLKNAQKHGENAKYYETNERRKYLEKENKYYTTKLGINSAGALANALK